MPHPHLNKREKGQTLILFVFAVVGLVALAALIIDGGSVYMDRRRAQTAADAAALAGAYAKCVEKGSLADIQAKAQQYAVTENHATALESVGVDADGRVNVQTRVDNPSYFASILGQQTDVARAQAAAGCFTPVSTRNLVPVAWSCGPPAGEPSTDDCTIHQIPIDVFNQLRASLGDAWFEQTGHLLDAGNSSDPANPDMNPADYHDGVGGVMAYLVMAANIDISAQCMPPFGTGTIDCDLNNDGILDVGGGGDRGWLALSGNGASDLVNLMVNGYSDTITTPEWFQGQTGTIANLFIQAETIKFNLVLVPIFDAICDGYTDTTLPTCPDYNPGEPIQPGNGTGGAYVRVAAFAPFVVTCVHRQGEAQLCPAQTLAGGDAADHNAKTMEGYFLSGVTGKGEIDPGGFDLGVYVISLTR